MLACLTAVAPPARLDVGVEGLRSGRGALLVCLTRDATHFPDCDGDPAAHHVSIPTAEAARLAFTDLSDGAYALAIVHDENGNGHLDKFLGVPLEGVGFSRNPQLGFGPPHFADASFAVATAATSETVRMKYFL